MVIKYGNPLLSRDEVAILLGSAGLAPSMHNTQPWRFEVTGRVIDVLLDEERTLPAEDPSGRMTRIGLGAAALNVRVAAAMLRYETTLAIDPDPDRQEIAVRIFLGHRQRTTAPLGTLYGELRRRRTYRGPLIDAVVSPLVLDQISAAARAEGVDLHWLDAAAKQRLLPILHAADDLELHDEDRLTERGKWVGGRRTGDGIPEAALGPLATCPGLVRDLSAGFGDPEREVTVFEPDPPIAILTTCADDQVAWTRAGLALQQALLTATTYDVTASFLNQAIEYAPLRAGVQHLLGHTVWPQLIIRAGYPNHAAADTPRIPWPKTMNTWQ